MNKPRVPHEKNAGLRIKIQEAVKMKYGVRNDLKAKVVEIKKGEIMSEVECVLSSGEKVASVLTTDSVEAMGLKAGDSIHLLVKAIHVIPAKD